MAKLKHSAVQAAFSSSPSSEGLGEARRVRPEIRRDDKWPLSVRVLVFVLGAAFFWSLWLGAAWVIRRLL